jgi:galactonate dehydratase
VKITAIDARLVDANFRNLIITQIHTDEGITGISEVVTKRFDDATLHGIRNLTENIGLIGKDPRQPNLHFERMYRDNQWTIGTVAVSAISAIEMAMWDIKGKEVGKPIYELFGGPTFVDRVPVYCHVPGGASPQEFADNIAAARERGYRVCKTTLPVYYGQAKKVSSDGAEYQAGGNAYSGTKGKVDGSHNEHQWLDRRIVDEVISYFEEARKVHGDAMEIWVDCHARLSGAHAVRLVHGLRGLADLIEEPLPPEDLDGLKALKQASYASGGPKIAAGERTATIHDRNMLRMVTEQMVDIFQPDIGNCGGFSSFYELASVAVMHNVAMAPHNPNGPLSVAQGLQAIASVRNGHILETVGNEAEEELAAELLINPKVVCSKDGYIELPKGPGLGVELNEKGLEKRPFQRYYQTTR